MKCKLTPITPCHVGSGNTLIRNIDFASDGEYFGIIDLRKVYDIVGPEGVQGWCSIIDRKGDILPYVRGRKPNATLRDICSTMLEIRNGDSSPSKPPTQLREHIRTMGELYIPASSLKGAIVTAILSADEYSKKLRIPSKINGKNNGIVDKFFSKAETNPRTGFASYNPQTSVLRFLRVSDACFKGVQSSAFYCNQLNIRKSEDKLCSEEAHQYVEAILEDAETMIDIDIKSEHMCAVSRKDKLGEIPEAMKSLSSLLMTINKHTLRLLEREKEFWADYNYPDLEEYLISIDDLIDECRSSKEGSAAILRVGYGCGWDSITGGWSKESANDDEWDRIVNASRPKNKENYSEYYFPKTRRVFDAYMPLGFMRIEIAEK